MSTAAPAGRRAVRRTGVWSGDEQRPAIRCRQAGRAALRRHAGLSGRGGHGHIRAARGLRHGQCHRPPAALSAGHRRHEHGAGRHLARHPHHAQRRRRRHQGPDRHAAGVRRLRAGRSELRPGSSRLAQDRPQAGPPLRIDLHRRLRPRRGRPARRQAGDHALGDGRGAEPALPESRGRGRPHLRARRQRLHLGGGDGRHRPGARHDRGGPRPQPGAPGRALARGPSQADRRPVAVQQPAAGPVRGQPAGAAESRNGRWKTSRPTSASRHWRRAPT